MELRGDYSEFAQNESKQTNSAKTCYSSNIKIDEPAKLDLNSDITKSEHHSTFGHQYVNLKMHTSRLHALFLYGQPYYVADERSFRYTKPSSPRAFYDFGDEDLKAHNIRSYEFYWKIYEEVKLALEPVVTPVFRSKFESKLDKLSFELARMVLPLSTKTKKWHTVNAESLLQHSSILPEGLVCHEEYINELFDKVFVHSPTATDYVGSRRAVEETEFFTDEDFSSGNHSNRFDCSSKFSGWYDHNILSDIAEEILNCQNVTHLHRLSPLGKKLIMKRVSGSYVMSASCLAQLIRHRPFSLDYKFLNGSFYMDEFLEQSPSYHEYIKYANETLKDQSTNPLKYYFRAMGNNLHVDFNVPCYDLINFTKKRLCFNAQKEVYDLAEFMVSGFKKNVDPAVVDHLYAPPCSHNFKKGVKPTCPEGVRYCRIPVWKQKIRERNF